MSPKLTDGQHRWESVPCHAFLLPVTLEQCCWRILRTGSSQLNGLLRP
ncbi:MAG: hypothetical protein QOF56_678 [Acidobacteriaceae bacterium]|jgi:hypothetical protein|nr:hypothetical protein [Acidobacteriaceae bacterium]